jgi:acetoin utilization deacetylase AcuC-like enzyme
MNLLYSSQAIKKLTLIKPRLATLEEIQLIHSNNYIKEVKSIAYHAGWLALDTPLSKESYRMALLSAGGALEAGGKVTKGKVINAFVLGRPPGHHAEKDRGAGFCIFNNISILAKHLQQAYGIKRILIVDWDVHHGNGTERIFYEDPSVLYFSTH